MAVTLEYVSLDTFSDVMREDEQAMASDDTRGTDPNTTPSRDDAMVKRFLKRAESRAESYLINYERPLDNVPMSLEYCIYILARHMLLERGDGTVSEEARQSYQECLTWLENVRDGMVDLEPAEEEDLEDFVGHGTYGALVFSEYPFVDKSATVRNAPLG